MPFDSRGNFTRVHSWEQDRQDNIDIMSDRHDEEDDNFAQGLNECMLRDGRCTMSGNLDMGNFKIHNIANGTGNYDAVNRSQMNSLDSNVVHLSGDEIIAGNKTFNGTSTLTTANMTTVTVANMTVTGGLTIPGGKIWIA